MKLGIKSGRKTGEFTKKWKLGHTTSSESPSFQKPDSLSVENNYALYGHVRILKG